MANSKVTSSNSSAPPEVLIIGTGVAGLTAAIHFSEFANVTILAKAEISEGNTRYAQGGIASVWSSDDSIAEHIQDTLNAGAGLCHADAVNLCATEGPARIQELIDWGVHFAKSPAAENRGYDLHREGGHQKRRILHAQDSTGQKIEDALVKKIQSIKNLTLLEHHTAIDLIMEGKLNQQARSQDLGRCLGAWVLNNKTGSIRAMRADLTIVASGGAGKVYLYTTNPDVATGDGIAMAHRAGARISNMEFMQFHPTCLYHPLAKNFLITEAMRGEGAILRTHRGEDLMKNYHAMGSLAPRDITARAIDLEMKRTDDPHVWLDCSNLSEASFREKFPQIAKACQQYGIDAPKAWIPVVPAAHYLCGGIQTDLNGLSSVPGLAAIGEAACTGIHGANRLASNSLLEGVVFSNRLAVWAKAALHHQIMARGRIDSLPEWDFGRAVDLEERIDISATWREIRTLMWNYVGIVRSDRRLRRARERLALIRHELNADYWKFKLTQDFIELRNLLTVAELIVESALRRKESRGLHYNVNYPTPLTSECRDTVI